MGAVALEKVDLILQSTISLYLESVATVDCKEIGMIFSNISTGKIIMKVPLSLALLFLLVWSGAGCGSMKAERDLAENEKKETRLDGEIEKEQRHINQVSKEIEQLKRDTAN